MSIIEKVNIDRKQIIHWCRMFKFKKNDVDFDDILKQLNMYTMQVALELEAIKGLGDKFGDINQRLSNLEKKMDGEFESRNNFVPLILKNKSAIKLILQRHGKISSSKLSQIIKLSRTRCNEYLIEMEKDGILVSKMEGKEKFYTIRR